jgi:hypothetical protein
MHLNRLRFENVNAIIQRVKMRRSREQIGDCGAVLDFRGVRSLTTLASADCAECATIGDGCGDNCDEGDNDAMPAFASTASPPASLCEGANESESERGAAADADADVDVTALRRQSCSSSAAAPSSASASSVDIVDVDLDVEAVDDADAACDGDAACGGDDAAATASCSSAATTTKKAKAKAAAKAVGTAINLRTKKALNKASVLIQKKATRLDQYVQLSTNVGGTYRYVMRVRACVFVCFVRLFPRD